MIKVALILFSIYLFNYLAIFIYLCLYLIILYSFIRSYLDVDECSNARDVCPYLTECINTDGSFTCDCNEPGYLADENNCVGNALRVYIDISGDWASWSCSCVLDHVYCRGIHGRVLVDIPDLASIDSSCLNRHFDWHWVDTRPTLDWHLEQNSINNWLNVGW